MNLHSENYYKVLTIFFKRLIDGNILRFALDKEQNRVTIVH